MSKAKKQAPKVALKTKDVKTRPTNVQLFQEYLQKGMKMYGCGISATPIIQVGQDGLIRVVNTSFNIVEVPKTPAKAPAAAQAPSQAK